MCYTEEEAERMWFDYFSIEYAEYLTEDARMVLWADNIEPVEYLGCISYDSLPNLHGQVTHL